ncbi:hypothetical protein [Allocoprobacillus halotolerans]|nr:hypothetical protein [Allocoprobacillus halotolerans]
MSNQVVSLKRISFANISLDSTLEYGQYRALNDQEKDILSQALR